MVVFPGSEGSKIRLTQWKTNLPQGNIKTTIIPAISNFTQWSIDINKWNVHCLLNNFWLLTNKETNMHRESN